jgi:hypothetical protein
LSRGSTAGRGRACVRDRYRDRHHHGFGAACAAERRTTCLERQPILPMGTQVAQAYLPTLHYLGEQ